MYSYLIVLYLMSHLTNLILVGNICIIITMTAETAQKLNFYLDMACPEPCIDAQVSLVKLLDNLKIVEEF